MTTTKHLIYRNSKFYIWVLRKIHGPSFDKRYIYMAGVLKSYATVLEAGCGPAILPTFLGPKTKYHGFDLNQVFVDHAVEKGLDVWVGNVLNKSHYKNCAAVVACDVFHHLNKTDRGILVSNCFSSAKKAFIICEPFIRKKTWSSNIRAGITAWFDSDGINTIRAVNYLYYGELKKEIEDGFGVIHKSTKRVTKEIGDDLVTIFYKN